MVIASIRVCIGIVGLRIFKGLGLEFRVEAVGVLRVRVYGYASPAH